MESPIAGPAWGIIVAAGRGERMGGVDKVFAELAGRPAVAWSLAAFKRCEEIDAVVVVAAPDQVARMRDLVEAWRFGMVRAVVAGGEHRQESVRAGLEVAGDASIVAIHDAARPLVTPEMIGRGVALARETGAVVSGVPSRDTVKEVAEGTTEIVRTPDRQRMWLAHTPQVFDRQLLLRAHASAGTQATDDAALVEAIGHPVMMYEGATWNLKITTAEDLAVAETLLRERFAR
jgi:2-C-methyl-D-erythritol 4-phosphate cytidylyltransferase